MEIIGRFIVTSKLAKIHIVIRNHVNKELHKDIGLDKTLDLKSIYKYITEVDKNHPEYLI